MNGRRALAAGALAALVGGTPMPAAAAEVILGSGEAVAVGRALCRLVNRADAGVGCVALATAGDEHNLDNVRIGALDFALVGSEALYAAVTKSGAFAFTDATFEDIREVLTLPGRAFTLVARRRAGISRIADLAGKRVNLGAPGSPARRTMAMVLAAADLDPARLALADQLPLAQQSLALCHGRLQAAAYMVASPSATVRRVTRLCDAAVVGLDADVITKVVAAAPYLAADRIAAGTYPGTDAGVATIASRLVLISATEVDAATVGAVVAAVLGDVARLGRMVPALADADPAAMIRGTGLAPRHRGAAAEARALGLF